MDAVLPFPYPNLLPKDMKNATTTSTIRLDQFQPIRLDHFPPIRLAVDIQKYSS